MPGLGLPPNARIVVYVGLDRVGDGLIKLPFLRALRQAFPQGELIWLAGKGESAYRTRLSTLVSHLLDAVVDNAHIGNHVGELLGPAPLGGQEFDLVIDTQRRTLTTLILKRLRARYFISGSAEFLLSTVKPPAGYKRPRALVQELLDLVYFVTGERPPPPPPLLLDPVVEDLAAHLLPRRGAKYVALAPGAGGAEKRWPLQNFVTIANSLAQNGHVPVMLLGPDERGWHDDLAAACDAVFPLQHSATAQYDMQADITVALAGRCSVGVAGDSGGGHLLAASGVPLVSLFGPSDPQKFAPIASKLTLLKAQRWGGDSMDKIPPSAVLQAVGEFLRG
jgi:ADP-heptose:LPS heptosyltransferase